jgi:hypothetical protein
MMTERKRVRSRKTPPGKSPAWQLQSKLRHCVLCSFSLFSDFRSVKEKEAVQPAPLLALRM